MANIWVQEWKSKNDPVEVMTITHNKLFFTTGSHKKSSHLNTTAYKLECSGQALSELAHRIQALSLQLFNTPSVTEVCCTDNFPHQISPIRRFQADGLLMPHILLVKI